MWEVVWWQLLDLRHVVYKDCWKASRMMRMREGKGGLTANYYLTWWKGKNKCRSVPIKAGNERGSIGCRRILSRGLTAENPRSGTNGRGSAKTSWKLSESGKAASLGSSVLMQTREEVYPILQRENTYKVESLKIRRYVYIWLGSRRVSLLTLQDLTFSWTNQTKSIFKLPIARCHWERRRDIKNAESTELFHKESRFWRIYYP